MKAGISRRETLKWMSMAAVSAIAAPSVTVSSWAQTAGAVAPDPKILGPFPILSTPFTESGAVDYEDLAREARFVDWCGVGGIIWPQSNDSISLLTKDEKIKGMETLAKEMRGRRAVLCLGVQGNDTAEMMEYARFAESLAPGALISRPPDSGKTQEDLRKYYRELATVAKRPVFIQTTGGYTYKGPAPSTDLLVELASEFPHFGYVKEEHAPIADRIRVLLGRRPPIRRVFSAAGGMGWLDEMRMGTEGLITERCAYADVLAKIWELHEHSPNSPELLDAYSKFLAMTDLSWDIAGGLRGPHLYILKQRGIIKTTVSRHYAPHGRVPSSPIVADEKLRPEEIAEIEYRFAALKPYLKQGFSG